MEVWVESVIPCPDWIPRRWLQCAQCVFSHPSNENPFLATVLELGLRTVVMCTSDEETSIVGDVEKTRLSGKSTEVTQNQDMDGRRGKWDNMSKSKPCTAMYTRSNL